MGDVMTFGDAALVLTLLGGSVAIICTAFDYIIRVFERAGASNDVYLERSSARFDARIQKLIMRDAVPQPRPGLSQLTRMTDKELAALSRMFRENGEEGTKWTKWSARWNAK